MREVRERSVGRAQRAKAEDPDGRPAGATPAVRGDSGRRARRGRALRSWLGLLTAALVALLLVLTFLPGRGPIPVLGGPTSERERIPAELEHLPAPVRVVALGATRFVDERISRVLSYFGPRTSVRARLVDAFGRPRVGARFSAWAHGHRVSARSDADGRVELSTHLVRARTRVWLSARADEGLAWFDDLTIEPSASRDLGELVLSPFATAEGTVVDADGRGLADVRVSLTDPRNAEALEVRLETHSLPAIWPTDADGHFRIEWLPCAPLRVLASGETRGVSEVLHARAGEALTGIRIELSPLPVPATQLGNVRDSEGSTLPDAAIHTEIDGRELVFACDEGGAFELPLAGLREFRAVLPDGRQSAPYGPRPGEHLSLRVEARKERVRVRLHGAGPSLEAATFERSGRLEPGDDGERATPRRFVEEDVVGLGAGEYELSLSLGRHVIWVAHPGSLRKRVGPFELTPGLAPLDVALAPAPRITGRVTRAGRGVAGASVWGSRREHVESDPDSPWLHHGRMLDSVRGRALRLKAVADDHGGFSISVDALEGDLAVDGCAEVYLFAKDEQGGSGAVGPFALNDSPAACVIELIATATVRGRIHGLTESELRGVTVRFRDDSGSARSTRPSSDGEFELVQLRPGSGRLRVLGEGESFGLTCGFDILDEATVTATLAAEFVEGETSLPLELAPGETREVTIVVPPREPVLVRGRLSFDGTPLAYAPVRVRDGRIGASARTHAGADGAFELVVRAAERVEVTVQTLAGRLAFDLPVRDGEVRLKRDLPTSALTLFASGEPVWFGLRSELIGGGSWTYEPMTVSGDFGSLRSSRSIAASGTDLVVPAGRVDVWTRSGRRTGSAFVELAPDEVRELDLSRALDESGGD